MWCNFFIPILKLQLWSHAVEIFFVATHRKPCSSQIFISKSLKSLRFVSFLSSFSARFSAWNLFAKHLKGNCSGRDVKRNEKCHKNCCTTLLYWVIVRFGVRKERIINFIHLWLFCVATEIKFPGQLCSHFSCVSWTNLMGSRLVACATEIVNATCWWWDCEKMFECLWSQTPETRNIVRKRCTAQKLWIQLAFSRSRHLAALQTHFRLVLNFFIIVSLLFDYSFQLFKFGSSSSTCSLLLLLVSSLRHFSVLK